VKHTGLYLD